MIPTLNPTQSSVPQGVTDFVSVARALDPKSKERAALLAVLEEIVAAGDRNAKLLQDIGAANDAIAFRNEAGKALADAKAAAAKIVADARSDADMKRLDASGVLASAKADAEKIGKAAQADRDAAAKAKREMDAALSGAQSAESAAREHEAAAKADRDAAAKDRKAAADLRADLDRRLSLLRQAGA